MASYNQKTIGDARVRDRSDKKNINYGYDSYMSIGRWTESSEGGAEMLVDFDLSALPARFTVPVGYVSIFLYDDPNDWLNANTNVACQLVTADFNEHTVTWNNKPSSVSSPSVILQVGNLTEGSGGTNEYRWDIASLLQTVGDGTNAWHGFRFYYTGTDQQTAKYFRSKEYGTTSQHPKLVMTWDYSQYPRSNVGDVWKNTSNMKVNVADSWKTVAGVKVNVGDVWKELT